MEVLVFIAIMAILMILPIIILFTLVRFARSQASKIKDNLLEEALKDKCLDIEVCVIPSKDDSIVYWLAFTASFFIFMGIVMPLSAFLSGMNDDIIFPVICMGMVMIIMGVVFLYSILPFKTMGRLIISSKLVILPVWGKRSATKNNLVFRLENVEKALIKRESFRKKKITGVSFQGKVFGELCLYKKDYRKYGEVISYLRERGMKVEDKV